MYMIIIVNNYFGLFLNKQKQQIWPGVLLKILRILIYFTTDVFENFLS